MEYLDNINKILSKYDFDEFYIDETASVYLSNYYSGIIYILNKYNIDIRSINIDTSSIYSENASTTELDNLLNEVNAN